MTLNKYFNLAGIWLVFITISVFLWAFFSIQSNRENNVNQPQQLNFRIISQTTGSFNQVEYTAFFRNSLWQIVSKEVLKVGYEYRGTGFLEEYNLQDSNEAFDLSLGFTGRLKTIGKLEQNIFCDLTCVFLSQNYQLQRSIRYNFGMAFCHNFYSTTSFLSPGIECSDVTGLSIGLILGGTDGFTKEMKAVLKKVGLFHIVVVSGFQVGLLATLLENLIWRAGFDRRSRFLFIGMGFFGMLFLVGPQPPVLRSILSFSLSYLSLAFLGRRLGGFRALIYSALIMLIINPFYLMSASFQLSFVASLSLVLVSSEDIFQFNWLNSAKDLFLTSLSAFLATAPILINLGAGLSFLTVIINIIFLPVIPFLSFLNLLALIPFLGQIPMFLLSVFQSLFLFILVQISPSIPTFKFAKLSLTEITIYYLLLIAFWTCTKYLMKKPLKMEEN